MEETRTRNLSTLRAIFASLEAGDWETVLDHWASDGVMELPFAPGGGPQVFEGFDAIAKNQRASRDMFSAWSTLDPVLYPTLDPCLFFAEYRSEAVVATTGKPYRNRYVGYFRFANTGKLDHWKEYVDLSAIRKAFRPG